MADLTQTAANVAVAQDGMVVQVVQVGEAVTQGQPAREAGGKYWTCFADTEVNAAAKAIFLTPASTDGYAVITSKVGKVNLGATLVVGTTYGVSGFATGKVAPLADLTTGDIVTVLGTASTTAILDLDVRATTIVSA